MSIRTHYRTTHVDFEIFALLLPRTHVLHDRSALGQRLTDRPDLTYVADTLPFLIT